MRLIPSHMPPAIVEVISDARSDFESWAGAKGYNLSPMIINGRFHHYMDPSTDDAWLGYSEATTRQRLKAAAIIRTLLPSAI